MLTYTKSMQQVELLSGYCYLDYTIALCCNMRENVHVS